MQKEQLLSISLNIGSYSKFIESVVDHAKRKTSNYICVSNVHMLVEAFLDSSFAKVVNNADMATPDGVPLTWGLRLLSGIRQVRVAGMDMLPDLLTACEKEKLPVFIYGGTNALINKTRAYFNEKYTTLPVAGMYSPPFRELTLLEDQEIVDKINTSNARIVFVVLGCPKQEKWMAAMKGKINAVMIGIGGALPVLVGMQKRAPKWLQKSGFEWVYRLAQDPKRLAKRYLFTNSIFVYLLLSRKIKNVVTGRKRTKFIPGNETEGRFFEKLA